MHVQFMSCVHGGNDYLFRMLHYILHTWQAKNTLAGILPCRILLNSGREV